MGEDYRNIPVKFFYKDIKQNFLSKEAGRPIWKTEEYISIMKPGNSKDISERRVKPSDLERWGSIYDKWKNKEEQIQNGTRLEVLPGIEQTKIERCKALNIFTLEQLINVDEEGVKNLGEGARDLINEARRYTQGSVAVGEIQKELDAIKIENKKLVKENEELRGRNYELINNGTECSERNATVTSTNSGSGKRGRVRKAVTVPVDESGLGVAGTA